MKILFAGLFSLLLLSGCVMPLRPGRSTLLTSSGATVEAVQSQNPKAATTQVYRRTEEDCVPPGKRVTESVETTIGAAQKDVAREVAAKLGSLRPVMWVGILVLLFGLASFHPYLRAIVGSVTTSVVIVVAGLGMIVLPSLIVGNEILILGAGVGVVVLYWFSHRHGRLQGMLDLNKDGIDDRKQ
jgi:ABC-type anion transport system duplicated permease subunit